MNAFTRRRAAALLAAALSPLLGVSTSHAQQPSKTPDGPQRAPSATPDAATRPTRPAAPSKETSVNEQNPLGASSSKAAPQRAAGSVSSELWGEVDGRKVMLHTLKNSKGTSVKATDYGTIVTEILVADRDGAFADVALGRGSLAEYVESNPYFGCTAGRCANRIAGGKFSIDGESFEVTTNNGPNHLHGGAKGFDKVVWEGTARMSPRGPSVMFRHVSPDGTEGYPGTVTAIVTYTLTENDELVVDMSATTDRRTPVNMAHHTYWNLAGHDSGTILEHELRIPASRYTPVDETLITTGELAPVGGTPFDFRKAKPVGRDIGQLPATATDPGGYDVNFIVDPEGGDGRAWLCATLRDPKSGRTMEIFSNQPGIQFYSGNFLDGIKGKGGATYEKFDGLCLETQAFPDSINKQGVEGWPDVILEPKRIYRHRMVHKFSAE